jgi:hypothetical protein
VVLPTELHVIRLGIGRFGGIECGTEVALYKDNGANQAQTARQPFQTLILLTRADTQMSARGLYHEALEKPVLR